MKALTTSREVDAHIGSSRAMLKFTAPWCGPCRAVAPAVDRLAQSHRHIATAEINIDQAPDIASQFAVRAVPTFLFFEKGKLVNTVKGADLSAVTAAFASLSESGVASGSYGPGRVVGRSSDPVSAIPRATERSAKASIPTPKSATSGINPRPRNAAPWTVRWLLAEIWLYIYLYFHSLCSVDAKKTAWESLPRTL